MAMGAIAALSLFLAATMGAASAFTPGCLITGMRFIDPVSTTPPKASGARSCQNLCAANSSCNGFTYYPDSGECWFSGSGAGTNLTLQAPGVPAYSGPKTCASPSPACSVSLIGEWPADTPLDSNAAFSTGYQPGVLQCWPKTSFNGSYGGCSEISTLDDTAAGWPGKCLGLQPKTLVGDETCEGTCKADVMCPGFQVGTDGSCWQGLGEGCYGGAPWNKSWTPSSAKRFGRGSIARVKELVGVQLIGLKLVFDKANADLMDDAVSQCKKVCYSVLKCQYWQFDRVSGCWIEDPAAPLPYPLTKASIRNSTYGSNVVGGEFIQRECSLIVTPTTTTTTEAAGGFPWWGWLLLALLLLCCIGGILALLLCGQKPKKAKKSQRALAKPPTPLVAEPVPTMQRAMPVYTSAPVYTAPPVYTAAPVYAAPMAAPAGSVVVPPPTTASRAAPLVTVAPMAAPVITQQEFMAMNAP